MKFVSFKFISTTVLLEALTGCGGGTSPGDPSVFLEPHQLGGSSGSMAVVAAPKSVMAVVNHELDATSFLNWAETTYPSLFEAPQSNKTIDIWTYRYYPKTDIYLGTNTSGDVLGLMGKGGGQYDSYPLGNLADFGCAVYPSDCATVNPAPVDIAVAESLLKDNKCAKCHSVYKDKTGPSYKNVAEKYKGQADAEAKLYNFLTTSPKIKVDGEEETHTNIKSTDEAAIKNVIGYILQQ